MTRRLSPCRAAGPWRVAVVEEWTVSAWARGGTVAGGSGEKRPLAILITGPSGLVLRSPEGAPLARQEVDALLPGALADFLNAASRDTLPPEEEEEDR